MPQIGSNTIITGEAGETITDKTYYCLTLEADQQYDLADTEGEDVSGILMSGNTADDTIIKGNAIKVCVNGRCSVMAGASFNAGVLLQSDDDGKAKLGETGDYCFGRALKTSTGDKDIVPVWVFASPVMIN